MSYVDYTVPEEGTDRMAKTIVFCRDIEHAERVEKENVEPVGDFGERPRALAGAGALDRRKSRSGGLIDREGFIARHLHQMIAPRTLAETHSLMTTAARMTRRIRLTCGQASVFSDAES